MGNKRSRVASRSQSGQGTADETESHASHAVPLARGTVNADAAQASGMHTHSTMAGAKDHYWAEDPLHSLPIELLNVIVYNLTPRERRPLRLASKYLCAVANKTAETLTVCNDMAQFVINAEREATSRHNGLGTSLFDVQPSRWTHSNGWVERLLTKFPNICYLDIKCTQQTLTTFSRHLVRDTSKPASSLPRNLVHTLAHNVRTFSRRHSAVLLCELLKHRASELVALRGNTTNFIDPKSTTDAQAKLWQDCITLVEEVLSLKGSTEAKNHEQFKYARDTLDDTLMELACCLQSKHSKFSNALLSKAADPSKAARGWRWLFYCLAQQRQAEAAIEAYKVVDKTTLNGISPTCLSELFRSLIDNEISSQPENKLRAITSESGSWTKFLYRGTTQLTAMQSREGALEKICCDLICKGFYDTCLNVINRFETEATANEVWQQLMGAHGLAGGCLPLRQWCFHDYSGRIDKLLSLVEEILANRRTPCYKELFEALVVEGMMDRALDLLPKSLVGGLDRTMFEAVARAYALRETPAGLLTQPTLAMLQSICPRLRDPSVKAELMAIIVSCHAAKGNLAAAVSMAESSPAGDDAAEADQAHAHAAALGLPHMPGNAMQLTAVPMHARMWHVIAAASVQQGQLESLVKALPHLAHKWVASSCSLASAAAGEVSDVTSTVTANSDAAPSVWQQIVTAMLKMPGGEGQIPAALNIVLPAPRLAAEARLSYQRDMLRATGKALLSGGRAAMALSLASSLGEKEPAWVGHLMEVVLPVLLAGPKDQSEQAVTQVVWLGGKGVQLPCATARPVLDILVQAKRLADAVTVSRTTEQDDQIVVLDDGVDATLGRLCDALRAAGKLRESLEVAGRITRDSTAAGYLLAVMSAALERLPSPDTQLALVAARFCGQRSVEGSEKEREYTEAFKRLGMLCLDAGLLSDALFALLRVQEQSSTAINSRDATASTATTAAVAGSASTTSVYGPSTASGSSYSVAVPSEAWAELTRRALAAGVLSIAREAVRYVRQGQEKDTLSEAVQKAANAARAARSVGGGHGPAHSNDSSREPEAGADGDDVMLVGEMQAGGGGGQQEVNQPPGGVAAIAAGAGVEVAGGGGPGANAGAAAAAMLAAAGAAAMHPAVAEALNAGLVMGVDDDFLLMHMQ